jgi:hypothetical protein
MPPASAKARTAVAAAFLELIGLFDSFRSREIGASLTGLGNLSETPVNGVRSA